MTGVKRKEEVNNRILGWTGWKKRMKFLYPVHPNILLFSWGLFDLGEELHLLEVPGVRAVGC